MPYDPTHPVNGEIADADEIREKFDFTQGRIDETNARIDLIPAGPAGPAGADGAPGAEGPQGPPFASAVVDGVATLNPGDAATVGVSFDGTNVRFVFGLPRGSDGAQGPPGEVSAAQLAAAIADTARNPNTVGAFPGTFSDPPTKAEMDAYVAWNEARWQSAVR